MEVNMFARKAVRLGVAWCKEVHGKNWRSLIDWDKLDMGHTDWCILGQLFKDVSCDEWSCNHFDCDWDDGFHYAVTMLMTEEEAVSMGFEKNYGNQGYSYEELTKEWLREAEKALYDPSGDKVYPGDQVVNRHGHRDVYRGFNTEFDLLCVYVENNGNAAATQLPFDRYFEVNGYTIH